MRYARETVRPMVGALACLWLLPAYAQEPPPPEPPVVVEEAVAEPEALPDQVLADDPAAEVETVPEPVAEPAPVTEAVPAATGGRRIVMLPVEFTVFQKSVAGMEAVPNWSETARYTLGEAAARMLRQDERFEIVPLPEFDAATGALLREHVELFKIVGDSATTFLQFGGKAWAEKKANFDYTIGDGLGFVAETAGADYAFLLAGAQVAQTGGAVFMQFLAAAGGIALPGGGTYIFTGIVDLRTGAVKWLNSKLGMQMFGVTGSDVRNPDTAYEVVTKMFEGFPASKLVDFPPF